MSQSSSDLKVRIVLNKPANEKPSEEYQYLWGRIIAVLLGVVLLLLVLIYLLSNNPASEDSQSRQAADTVLQVADDVVEAQNQIKEAEVLPVTAHAAVNENQASAAATAKQVKVTAKTSTKPQAVSKTELVPVGSAEVSHPDQENVPAFKHIRTEIYSPAVTRFTLSKAIREKEPLGDAASIMLDANDIATVYAFSEVAGMKDEFIYYVWKINGKEIARVKVGVWNNAWRSYSRKFFNQSMHGDVAVELYHGKNQRLASITMSF